MTLRTRESLLSALLFAAIAAIALQFPVRCLFGTPRAATAERNAVADFVTDPDENSIGVRSALNMVSKVRTMSRAIGVSLESDLEEIVDGLPKQSAHAMPGVEPGTIDNKIASVPVDSFIPKSVAAPPPAFDVIRDDPAGKVDQEGGTFGFREMTSIDGMAL